MLLRGWQSWWIIIVIIQIYLTSIRANVRREKFGCLYLLLVSSCNIILFELHILPKENIASVFIILVCCLLQVFSHLFYTKNYRVCYPFHEVLEVPTHFYLRLWDDRNSKTKFSTDIISWYNSPRDLLPLILILYLQFLIKLSKSSSSLVPKPLVLDKRAWKLEFSYLIIISHF